MHLLYCLNGLVVVIHDDQQTYVDPASYGTGVRIIPWKQPLGDLTYSGTYDPSLPPPPYEQPTETPAILQNYASQVRFELVIAGITFSAASGPVPVSTDRISQMLIGNLAMYASTLAPTDVVDFTQGSVHYPLTAAECTTLNTNVNNFVQQCRTVEGQCIDDLTSASPTILTYDDVDAKFSGLRSKTLRFGKK
jgi:hypothetical protein